ncbi:hypothetical protein L3Q82_013988 [Scortum barcoo]|uniref:Uncharacterized protein n=1 Tax=Scortum barcoo TaxID=214431 RepID=A0ACB8VXC7_9TELE|nr:hypothetical protein L3Q82_013988 [Scortum barcoo]
MSPRKVQQWLDKERETGCCCRCALSGGRRRVRWRRGGRTISAGTGAQDRRRSAGYRSTLPFFLHSDAERQRLARLLLCGGSQLRSAMPEFVVLYGGHLNETVGIRAVKGKRFFVGGDFCGAFPRRDLHAAVGGTASRLSRLAIRDLGLISHRAETRPLSPPLSLNADWPRSADDRARRKTRLLRPRSFSGRGEKTREPAAAARCCNALDFRF